MTSSGSRFKQWDVVVVPFPYSDEPSDKVRPAVVLSSPQHVQRTGVCYLAMVTSAANAGWPGDVPVSNVRGAGLPVPSVVRPAKIMTLNASRIVRRLGALPKADQAQVVAAVRVFLAR